ncbi:MAG: [FeFe] hydrogenase H-cluster maturation GTPase HydF [Lentisphaerae bacterium]|nr:[FeFe] hydrogenase H-cluster maturation GTPase HydF [Lentisphaerota bacterium]
MNSTAKSMRLQIAVFGRTNTGKSSLVNYISNQNVAITSPLAGTTTDAVEKAMEFAPIGPVLFIDTAGFDDPGELGGERIKRTEKIFDRSDVAVLVATPQSWGATELEIIAKASAHKIPVITVLTHCDIQSPTPELQTQIKQHSQHLLQVDPRCPELRSDFIDRFRAALLAVLPEQWIKPPPLLGDLIRSGDLVVMVVPIDLQAPRGRLIMPQVQSIRDVLDHNAMILVLKEDRFAEVIRQINPAPALVVCDSQVVKMVTGATPPGIPCTTFSILFSRLKGDTRLFLRGCQQISALQDGDRILIAEACTHHPTCEDIGRVKLPVLLKKATGKALEFDFAPGRDFPENLAQYKLIVHCGSCMLNRQETMWRLHCAEKAQIPITNYGMAISYCQGVLDKVLVP